MTSPYYQTEQDIIRTCGYITDDSYIASIFGVSIHKVKRLREKRPKSTRIENRSYKNTGSHINSNDSEINHVKMMELGSKNLLNAIMTLLYEREKRIRNAAKSRRIAQHS